MEIKLPPLPETDYKLGIQGDEHEPEWLSNCDAWDDSAMQAYATAAAVEQDRAQRGEPAHLCGHCGRHTVEKPWPVKTSQERKPLTAQELDALIERWVGCVELSDSEYNSMVMFARTIEHSHGIKP